MDAGLLNLLRDAIENYQSDFIEQLVAEALKASSTSPRTLSEIYLALSQTNASAIMDALTLIPLLLPSDSADAYNISMLVATQCSAKEVVLAVGEQVENVRSQIDATSEEEFSDNTFPRQCYQLIRMYAKALPRITISPKRLPSQTLTSVASGLQGLVTSSADLFKPDECKQLVEELASMILSIQDWARRNSKDLSEAQRSNTILHGLLTASIEEHHSHLRTSLAVRELRNQYPRQGSLSTLDSDCEKGYYIISRCNDAMEALTPLPAFHNVGDFILFSHVVFQKKVTLSETVLRNWLPTIMTCLSSNVALDESLFILLSFSRQIRQQLMTLPATITSPLLELLAPIASIHPDPQYRLIAFRLIALLLDSSPTPLKVEALFELLFQSTFPQMRVAAVSLLKDTIIQDFGAGEPSFFTSPELLRRFGPIIFRSDHAFPLGSMDTTTTTKFFESHEPARLTECLGIYYILLCRDKDNRTGIHDETTAKSLESNLLEPIRTILHRANSNADKPTGHPAMALLSLEIALERVDEARKSKGR